MFAPPFPLPLGASHPPVSPRPPLYPGISPLQLVLLALFMLPSCGFLHLLIRAGNSRFQGSCWTQCCMSRLASNLVPCCLLTFLIVGPSLGSPCVFFPKYLFLERGEGGVEREGEKHQCVVASHVPLPGDLACNPGPCPHWESNRWPFGAQAHAPTTELCQPGPYFFFLISDSHVATPVLIFNCVILLFWFKWYSILFLCICKVNFSLF